MRSRRSRTREPGRIVGARAGSPLLVGHRRGRPLPRLRRERAWLRDPAASCTSKKATSPTSAASSYAIYDATGGARVAAGRHRASLGRRASSSVRTAHFMQKEIFEQPRAIADTLESVGGIEPDLFGGERSRRCSLDVDAVHDPRLRHELLRRGWSRSCGSRRLRGMPCAGRDRERIPLPRQRAESRCAGRRRLAIGRDRRHARRAQARAGARARAHARDLQRRDELDGAADRARLSDARRHRDRRRVDQGVHDAARRAVPARR